MKNKVYTSYEEFEEIISDIERNAEVQEMNNFRHHNKTTRYLHSKSVAYESYNVCKKLGLDYTSAARGGMLHDLFLYDSKIGSPNEKGMQLFTHPRLALNNANRLFELNKKEQNIILRHMWPVTIIPPKYLEGFIVTIMDKHCAIKEAFIPLIEQFKFKKVYKLSYISFFLLAIPRII